MLYGVIGLVCIIVVAIVVIVVLKVTKGNELDGFEYTAQDAWFYIIFKSLLIYVKLKNII